jgi:hypothetical protein
VNKIAPFLPLFCLVHPGAERMSAPSTSWNWNRESPRNRFCRLRSDSGPIKALKTQLLGFGAVLGNGCGEAVWSISVLTKTRPGRGRR